LEFEKEGSMTEIWDTLDTCFAPKWYSIFHFQKQISTGDSVPLVAHSVPQGTHGSRQDMLGTLLLLIM